MAGELIRVIPDYLTPGQVAEYAAFTGLAVAFADVVGDSGRSVGIWHERLVPMLPKGLMESVRALTPEGERLETLRFSEMRPGNYHVCHRDNQTLEVSRGYWKQGEPNHTPQRTGTAIIYLTECEGGEIYFPELHERVIPKPGLAVTFPAHVTHCVFRVLSGVRQAITIWYVKA